MLAFDESEERSSLESILEYAQILWRWVWLILLAALIAGGVSYYITNRQPRVYQSSTLVMVNGASGSSVDTYSTLYLGQMLAGTYSNTMLTGPVLEAVSAKTGFQVYPGKIKINTIQSTSLIKVTVTDGNPERAALIANTLVSVFSDQVFTDQTSRYSDLKASLEAEISSLDNQIESVQEKLAGVVASLEAQSPTATNPSATQDPNDLLAKSQYESSLAQLQQSRNYVVQTYQQVKLAEAQSTSTLIQKDPAVPNYSPVQPQPLKSGLLAAIIGLMGAAGIIFLISFLEDEIRDPQEITRKFGVPVLGLIASFKTDGDSIITMTQPRSPVSEAYRSLRTNLQFSSVEKPLKTIVVTSASPSDGKTTIVANLATVLAQNEKDVVVVDSDLRRPRIHKVFSLTNRLGLSDYFIRSSENLTGVIKKTNIKGLSAITSGSLPPNPSELLNSTRMAEVVGLLGTRFNHVILDTPPLLAVTDALVLAPRVDGVILVIDPARTKRGALRHAIEQLQTVNAHLLGVVLNNVKIKRSHYYYNRDYYYGKKYGKSADSNPNPGSEITGNSQ